MCVASNVTHTIESQVMLCIILGILFSLRIKVLYVLKSIRPLSGPMQAKIGDLNRGYCLLEDFWLQEGRSYKRCQIERARHETEVDAGCDVLDWVLWYVRGGHGAFCDSF